MNTEIPNTEAIQEQLFSLDKAKFAWALKRHKNLVKKFERFSHELFKKESQETKITKDSYIIAKGKDMAKELSLVAAGFKCQKCGSIDRLSWHHLIPRKAKEYMPFNRYLNARYYWSNVVILCWKCHKAYHDIIDKGKSEMETDIDKKLIENLKKKYQLH